MNKSKCSKKNSAPHVNIAAVLSNYFLGGLLKKLKKETRVGSAHSQNKYDPHQGKREKERRAKRTK